MGQCCVADNKGAQACTYGQLEVAAGTSEAISGIDFESSEAKLDHHLHPNAKRLPNGVPEEAPSDSAEDFGLVGNCILVLPHGACQVFNLKPNINDKGFEKRLWLGRTWQLRKLMLKRYRESTQQKSGGGVLSKQVTADWQARYQNPQTQEIVLYVQKRWRAAVIRRRGKFSFLGLLAFEPSSIRGTVLFMHGSGGMTYNNVRYARTLAGMGFLVIAPDSLIRGEDRRKKVAPPIRVDQDTPYWDDLGLYTSDASGSMAYSTDAAAVLADPEKWRTLYENIYRMRRDEMHWILSHLPQFIRLNGIFTMGQSEGAMTVARFDDQRYGSMIRGRIISAFSVEYCYFTPTRAAGEYGGSTEVPTLNIIGDDDQFFGINDSVAKHVCENKALGGYGADNFTGNGYKNMKRQKLRRGVVAVLEGARHDASETHDNILRDLLSAFMSNPGSCHMIPSFWQNDTYLAKQVKTVEQDFEGGGFRTWMHVGANQFPTTLPYQLEVYMRGQSPGQAQEYLAASKADRRAKSKAFEEYSNHGQALAHRGEQVAEAMLLRFKESKPKMTEPKRHAYDVKRVEDMPRKAATSSNQR